MATSTSVASGVDVSDALLEVLRRADRPLTLSEMHRDLTAVKVPKSRVAEVLRELIQQQRAFLCSPAGKQDRYWGYDEYQKIVEKTNELFARTPTVPTESDLVRRLAEALPKVSSTSQLKEFVRRMKAEGQLFEHPVKGRTTRMLGIAPFDAATLVQLNKNTVKNLRDTLQKIQSYGGTIEQLLDLVRRDVTQPAAPEATHGEQARQTEITREEEPATAAAPVNEIEDLILKGMRDLGPNVEQGTPVSLAELRRNMPSEYQSREAFDRAVLRLGEEGKLALYREEQADALPEAERQELVRDDNGAYFSRAAYPV